MNHDGKPTLNEIRGMLAKHHPAHRVFRSSGVVAMIDRLRSLKMDNYYLGGFGVDRDRLAGLMERKRREFRAERRFVEADLLREILRECRITIGDKAA